MRFCRTCKTNYAVKVGERGEPTTGIRVQFEYYKRIPAPPIGVDDLDEYGIMCLTHSKEVTRGRSSPPRGQVRSSTPPPRPQPQAPGGHRSDLQRRRPVLRCSGSGSGQVRDAAPRSPGGTAGDRDGGRVRLLASLLLPGPDRLRGDGPARTPTPATGAQARPQAVRGDRRPSSGRAHRGPHSELGRARATARGALRSARPSTQRRAGTDPTPKKGAPGSAMKRAGCTELAVAYEALRAHALGQLSTSTLRVLSLFLAAGLPAWVAAWTDLVPASRPAPAPSGRTHAPAGIDVEMVRVLVGMALNCDRERIS